MEDLLLRLKDYTKEINIGTVLDRIKIFLQVGDNQCEVLKTREKEVFEFGVKSIINDDLLVEAGLVFWKKEFVDKDNPLMLPHNNKILNLSNPKKLVLYLGDINNYQRLENWANTHKEQTKYRSYSKIILEKMIPNINNKIIPEIQKLDINEELNETVAKLLKKRLIQPYINKLVIAMRACGKDEYLKKLLAELKEYISKLGYINLIIKENTLINNQDFEWFAEYFEISGRGEVVKLTTSPAYFLKYINDDGELDYCVVPGNCIVDDI